MHDPPSVGIGHSLTHTLIHAEQPSFAPLAIRVLARVDTLDLSGQGLPVHLLHGEEGQPTIDLAHQVHRRNRGMSELGRDLCLCQESCTHHRVAEIALVQQLQGVQPVQGVIAHPVYFGHPAAPEYAQRLEVHLGKLDFFETFSLERLLTDRRTRRRLGIDRGARSAEQESLAAASGSRRMQHRWEA